METTPGCSSERPSSVINLSKVPMMFPQMLRTTLKLEKSGTIEDVVTAMKDYIYQRRLFDAKNPLLIHCGKDDLGKALGVNQFTVGELKTLLLKILIRENREYWLNFYNKYKGNPGTKRKLEELIEPHSKKFCTAAATSGTTSTHTSAAENCSGTLNNSESQRLVLREVQEVADSSDTDDENTIHAGDILALEETYDVEYDVESSDSCSSGAEFTDTNSDRETIQNILKAAFSAYKRFDSDREFWADQSSEECPDSDLEISESDKWVCKKCGSCNKPPFRYCLKCWNERMHWIREKKGVQHKKPSSSNKSLKSGLSSSQLDTPDTSSSQPILPTTSASVENEVQSKTDASMSQESQSVKLCNLCLNRPMNATLVHGKIGHQYGCYRCSRRLLSKNDPCPVCRRTIERVIHQIVIDN